MKKLLMAMLTCGLATSAMAGWNFPVGGTDQNEHITIGLTVDQFIQIDWQDLAITYDMNSDWWSSTLGGVAYQSCPDDGGKYAFDAWGGASYYAGAGGRYYESGDGGVIYVNSNDDLTMVVGVVGDLTGGNTSATLPTYFTCAFAPFQIGSTAITTGTIPGDGQGCYLGDAGGNMFSIGNSAYNYPSQHPFPCSPATSWSTGSMSPQVEGTIKFLARVHRHGMADPADTYSTHLDVTFSNP
jgi:hypothetical protein